MLRSIIYKMVLMTSFFPAASLQAWWADAHRIVAEIASQHLNSEAKEKVESLIKILEPFYPDHYNPSFVLSLATIFCLLATFQMNRYGKRVLLTRAPNR